MYQLSAPSADTQSPFAGHSLGETVVVSLALALPLPAAVVLASYPTLTAAFAVGLVASRVSRGIAARGSGAVRRVTHTVDRRAAATGDRPVPTGK
ncbi:MAG: hypothetical protein ABEJ40_04705 [Haloarculaceae archaeon]